MDTKRETASQADPRNLVAASPLFKTGNPADADAVLARMRKLAFGAGQVIFSAGDEGDLVYLVLEGRIKLSIITEEGRELSVAHAGPGDVFGEIAALDGGARTTYATALAPTKAMGITKGDLAQLLAKTPGLALAAARFLCHRLRATDAKLEGLALHSLEVRLARFLISEAETRQPETALAQRDLDLPFSQSDLALLIGASRPKVNAALAELESAGAIGRKGQRLVLNMAQLRLCAAIAG